MRAGQRPNDGRAKALMMAGDKANEGGAET